MFDINPLTQQLHLRELERAATKPRRLPPKRRTGLFKRSAAMAVTVVAIAATLAASVLA